jgi:hypothetical protein
MKLIIHFITVQRMRTREDTVNRRSTVTRTPQKTCKHSFVTYSITYYRHCAASYRKKEPSISIHIFEQPSNPHNIYGTHSTTSREKEKE